MKKLITLTVLSTLLLSGCSDIFLEPDNSGPIVLPPVVEVKDNKESIKKQESDGPKKKVHYERMAYEKSDYKYMVDVRTGCLSAVYYGVSVNSANFSFTVLDSKGRPVGCEKIPDRTTVEEYFKTEVPEINDENKYIFVEVE